MRIDELIAKLEAEEMFPKVVRRTYKFDKETALKFIQAIGARVCPSFTIDEANKGVFEALASWVEGCAFNAIDPSTKKFIGGRIDRGIYLYGGTGAGKSVAMEVMKAFTDLDEVCCKYGKVTAPLKWRKVRADEITRSFLETGDVSRWIEEKSLLIDDLGNEPAEVLYMGNRVDALRMVLEARGERRDQITLITSNLPLGIVKGQNPILERYGARVESRLVEMCNYIYLGGQDRRLTLTL